MARKIPGTVDTAFVSVKVQPRASRNAVLRRPDGSIKVYLTAPAVEGAANKALLILMADRLALPRRSIEIAAGENNRNKRLRVVGVDQERLNRRLAGISEE